MPARSRALLAAQIGLVLAAFRPTLTEWAPLAWNTPRLGYVLLVPVLALILALTAERCAPAPAHENASPRAPLPLAAAAACLAVGVLLGRFTLALAGLPLAVVGLVSTWGGASAVRRHAWALVMLAFMVPLPQPLVDRIQPWAAAASGRTALWMLAPLDPDCSWIGSTLHYRGWELLVSEACAGSGTTLILMVLSVFLGGLFRLRPAAAMGLVALALPASLLVNSARIALTGVILDRFGPSAVDGVPHELLGQALVIGASGLIAFGVARLAPSRGRSVS
ncbi:MAG: exosortase/archaeosortase family protein [Planctomycetota bacterium]|nr:exosortase/archaeosortase family protein [Planctomycetota bacterium]